MWVKEKAVSPITSHEHHFYGVTRGFTRLIMKTKYVCHGLNSWYANYHNNVNIYLICKILHVGGGGGGKRATEKSPPRECLLCFSAPFPVTPPAKFYNKTREKRPF